MVHVTMIAWIAHMGLPNVMKIFENRRPKYIIHEQAFRFPELCNVFICDLFLNSLYKFLLCV